MDSACLEEHATLEAIKLAVFKKPIIISLSPFVVYYLCGNFFEALVVESCCCHNACHETDNFRKVGFSARTCGLLVGKGICNYRYRYLTRRSPQKLISSKLIKVPGSC